MAMLRERIHRLGFDAALVNAWREVFRNPPEVVPERRDYVEQPADAMVSPANSFGVMDGGLDLAIRAELAMRTA